jgi:2-hydroxychromene-2-carboxylate isomerase
MQVQFLLDYRSPYAYLANTQMALLDAQIDYEPIDILAVMKKVNNQPSPMCPPKAKYAGLDAMRWANIMACPILRTGRCSRRYGRGFSREICFRGLQLQASSLASPSKLTTLYSARFGPVRMI